MATEPHQNLDTGLFHGGATGSFKSIDHATEKQIKGIDLAVRATKKVFPFIKGWEFTPDWEKYSTVIYINLIVDFVELGKTMDMEVKSYFFYFTHFLCLHQQIFFT